MRLISVSLAKPVVAGPPNVCWLIGPASSVICEGSDVDIPAPDRGATQRRRAKGRRSADQRMSAIRTCTLPHWHSGAHGFDRSALLLSASSLALWMAMMPTPSHAQSATWTGAGLGTWNNLASWLPTTVPGTTGTATFGTSAVPTVAFTPGTASSVGTISLETFCVQFRGLTVRVPAQEHRAKTRSSIQPRPLMRGRLARQLVEQIVPRHGVCDEAVERVQDRSF
jgi:hypothetical protein